MPIYDFRNKKTGEVFEEMMSISAREQYLKDNPHMKQCYTKVPGIIRGTVSAGNVDNHGFKEVLQKVGEAHPNSAVAKQHTRRTTKEIKTKQVLDKHRKLQARKKGRKNV